MNNSLIALENNFPIKFLISICKVVDWNFLGKKLVKKGFENNFGFL